MSTIENGKIGELEVIEHVTCPNCNKQLMLLPPSFPLFDVQCVGCYFRAQVKTSNNKPKRIVFGSTWDIADKVFRAGYMMPPLFLNFKWSKDGVLHQEIRFYPFVPKKNLRKRVASETAKRPGEKMFDYIGLDLLPHFIVYTV